ncbi:unnamed protein product [Rotaria sordida]|uniref:Uncharacterized protein n=1 Tax=Rotaria sordida TaxID=392033 RepID=A0A815GAV1_9BILA|nr:unnamed protein product [Rotaria sordida]
MLCCSPPFTETYRTLTTDYYLPISGAKLFKGDQIFIPIYNLAIDTELCLSSNHTLIYLLYTYTEPYQLVKLNTSTLHPLARAILPFHYNDTTFRQDFFLLTFSDDQLFVGYVEDLGRPEAATWLQAIDLRSMTINNNLKQGFPFKQFTGFPLFQAISNQQKIIVNLWQWSVFLTVNSF